MIEEREKREIITDMRNKGAESRRTVGLMVGGVGGILYLIIGLSQIKLSLGNPFPSYSGIIGITNLLIGIISMVGTLIGIRNVKLGGVLNLISIPTSLVIGFILFSTVGYISSWYNYIPFLFGILFPLPIPHSFHVISGGILSLTGSDIR
jgi:hypothetical protein